jgi:histidinol-phosphatase
MPSAELKAALEAAEAAAVVIRELYQRNLAVVTKADKSPVTEADIRAEEAIRAVLSARSTARSLSSGSVRSSRPRSL